jgi:membrane-associated protease RseP (regulator of RpoE activity)
MLTKPAPPGACLPRPIWESSMPTSPSSSIGSPDPYGTVSEPDDKPLLAPIKWRVPALLFVATVASILYTAAALFSSSHEGGGVRLADGVSYMVSLLAILLTHEFAHYLFARHHGVNASLPHFIPMPLLSPFGTMGAVIIMRDRIKSKNALLDIGASGPLAGMVVAIPVLLYGLAHSQVSPPVESGMQEGQSLFYWILKSIAIGPIPDGWDVQLHPMAFAGWTGLFITMLNLLPVGQLDGGHVAYALFGPRQNQISKFIRYSLLLLVPINAAWRLAPALHGGLNSKLVNMAISASTMWLGWFVVLTVLERLSGGGHPPTEPGELSPGRRIVAIGSLILFVLLFMPTPLM